MARHNLDAASITGLLARAEAGKKLGPDDIPPVEDSAQKAAYEALAQNLYNGLNGPPDERARTPRGHVASILWQRVAEWEDAKDEG